MCVIDRAGAGLVVVPRRAPGAAARSVPGRRRGLGLRRPAVRGPGLVPAAAQQRDLPEHAVDDGPLLQEPLLEIRGERVAPPRVAGVPAGVVLAVAAVGPVGVGRRRPALPS